MGSKSSSLSYLLNIKRLITSKQWKNDLGKTLGVAKQLSRSTNQPPTRFIISNSYNMVTYVKDIRVFNREIFCLFPNNSTNYHFLNVAQFPEELVFMTFLYPFKFQWKRPSLNFSSLTLGANLISILTIYFQRLSIKLSRLLKISKRLLHQHNFVN